MAIPKSFIPDQQAAPASFQPETTPAAFTPQKKSVGGFVGNVFKSGANFVGNTASGIANVFNPDLQKNTALNLGRVAVGGVEKLIPGQQGQEQHFDAVTDFYKQRYGGLSNIGKTLYEDPVGFASDASVLFGGAGLALKGAGATKAAQVASKTSKVLDPIQAASTATGKTVSAFGKSKPVQAASEKLANYALKTPTKYADQGVAKAFLTRNLGGKSMEKVYQATSKETQATGKVIDTTLGKSTQMFRPTEILDGIVKAANEKGSFITRAALKDRIQRFVPDYAKLLNKKTLTATEANSLRKAVDTNLKEATFLGKELTNEQATVRAFNSKLRASVKEKTGTQDLFQKESEAIRISKRAADAAKKSSTQGRPGFLDVASAGIGYAAGNIPGAAVGVFAERMLRSPRVQGAIAQALFNTRNADKALSKLSKQERTFVLNAISQIQKSRPNQQ